MANVIIRDVDPSILADIDEAAARLGLTRNALLIKVLERHVDEQTPDDLTHDAVVAFGSSARDLLDDELRDGAWRR